MIVSDNTFFASGIENNIDALETTDDILESNMDILKNADDILEDSMKIFRNVDDVLEDNVENWKDTNIILEDCDEIWKNTDDILNRLEETLAEFAKTQESRAVVAKLATERPLLFSRFDFQSKSNL